MNRRLEVRGLHCSHCIEILERDLQRLPGMRQVRIDPLGWIEIDFDPYRVSDTMIVATIRDAGFHLAPDRRPRFEDEAPWPEPGGEEPPRPTDAEGGDTNATGESDHSES